MTAVCGGGVLLFSSSLRSVGLSAVCVQHVKDYPTDVLVCGPAPVSRSWRRLRNSSDLGCNRDSL